MKTYEGMFLVDAGQPDFEQAVAPVRTVLQRSNAEVLHLKKWDERRLAYEIQGRRRGLYVLSYFKAEPEKIAEIEHDVRLNEKILRVMILSADHVSADKMTAPTPAEIDPAKREEEAEGFFGEREDRYERRYPRRDRERERGPRPAEDAPPAIGEESQEQSDR